MEITWPLGNTFGVGAGKHRCGGGFQGLWKAGMWEMSMRFAFKRRTDSVRRRRGRRGFGRAYHSEWLIARSSHPPAQPWAARYVGCQQGLQKPALTLLRPAPAHTLLPFSPKKSQNPLLEGSRSRAATRVPTWRRRCAAVLRYVTPFPSPADAVFSRWSAVLLNLLETASGARSQGLATMVGAARL